MASRSSTSSQNSTHANGQGKDPLDTVTFFIGRAYYNYVGMLERLLVEEGLYNLVRPGMGHILFVLFQTDDCIIKEISKRVQLSSSTMTGLLDRMVRAGLVTKRRDDADAFIPVAG